MVKENYQMDLTQKNVAKAMSKNRRVSLKYATEMCREIRGRPVFKAEEFINRILSHEAYLPLRKYRKKVAHRKGTANVVPSGRYPENLCKVFLDLLNSVKSNAVDKGLDEDSLLIMNAFASEGFGRKKGQPKGRIGGKLRRRKSTHLEIVVQESKGVKKEKKEKK